MIRTRSVPFLMLGLFLAWPLGSSPAMGEDAYSRHITVQGQAEIQAVPDIATLSIGVETEAETPNRALGDNAERMRAVIDRLSSAGLAERDMQTSQLGIWLVYADRQQPRQVVGYRASNQLTITLRDIDRLGPILDEAVADGANRVNGPTFSIADPAPHASAAREAAVKDAIAKAERYAAAADLQLGEVISITEGGGAPIFQRQLRAESMAAATPIAPGETTISASVTMTFAID